MSGRGERKSPTRRFLSKTGMLEKRRRWGSPPEKKREETEKRKVRIRAQGHRRNKGTVVAGRSHRKAERAEKATVKQILGRRCRRRQQTVRQRGREQPLDREGQKGRREENPQVEDGGAPDVRRSLAEEGKSRGHRREDNEAAVSPPQLRMTADRKVAGADDDLKQELEGEEESEREGGIGSYRP